MYLFIYYWKKSGPSSEELLCKHQLHLLCGRHYLLPSLPLPESWTRDRNCWSLPSERCPIHVTVRWDRFRTQHAPAMPQHNGLYGDVFQRGRKMFLLSELFMTWSNWHVSIVMKRYWRKISLCTSHKCLHLCQWRSRILSPKPIVSVTD